MWNAWERRTDVYNIELKKMRYLEDTGVTLEVSYGANLAATFLKFLVLGGAMSLL